MLIDGPRSQGILALVVLAATAAASVWWLPPLVSGVGLPLSLFAATR